MNKQMIILCTMILCANFIETSDRTKQLTVLSSQTQRDKYGFCIHEDQFIRARCNRDDTENNGPNKAQRAAAAADPTHPYKPTPTNPRPLSCQGLTPQTALAPAGQSTITRVVTAVTNAINPVARVVSTSQAACVPVTAGTLVESIFGPGSKHYDAAQTQITAAFAQAKENARREIVTANSHQPTLEKTPAEVEAATKAREEREKDNNKVVPTERQAPLTRAQKLKAAHQRQLAETQQAGTNAFNASMAASNARYAAQQQAYNPNETVAEGFARHCRANPGYIASIVAAIEHNKATDAPVTYIPGSMHGAQAFHHHADPISRNLLSTAPTNNALSSLYPNLGSTHGSSGHGNGGGNHESWNLHHFGDHFYCGPDRGIENSRHRNDGTRHYVVDSVTHGHNGRNPVTVEHGHYENRSYSGSGGRNNGH